MGRIVWLWVIVSLVLAGCGQPLTFHPVPTISQLVRSKGVPGADQPFPKGFLWGVSTAGYQYDGYDGTSNWAKWEDGGHVAQPSGTGIDGYHRYAADLDLAKGMGLSAYRMSLEWSRIEPVRGQLDPVAVAHYHEVIAAAVARGLTPFVTLNHFTYPAWLDHPLTDGSGGWESDETVVAFQKFTTWAAKEYGHDVHYWLTINEPNTFALCGYLLGIQPPGKRNPLAYQSVLTRLVKAHRAAYSAIHAVQPDAMVSLNPFVFRGRSATPRQVQGFNPSEDAIFDEAMGLGAASASPTLDYVAFDYYYPVSPGDWGNVTRDWNWSVYPEGMYETCRALYSRYKLPLFVAENGMATDGDMPRADGWTRSAFLVNHVAQLRRAMGEGVPVIGYSHWSLADNWEWGTFEPRFGLFAIDRRDPQLTRIRTEAVDTYQAIATTNALSPSLLDRYLGKRH